MDQTSLPADVSRHSYSEQYGDIVSLSPAYDGVI